VLATAAAKSSTLRNSTVGDAQIDNRCCANRLMTVRNSLLGAVRVQLGMRAAQALGSH
jgi:hypothetical protein